MKKHLIFSITLAVLLVGAHTAFAATGADTSNNFVPLTNIPAITDFQNTPDFTSFLNSLYKIAIGIAVFLAVIQIIRAGVLWMSAGGSSENISKARNLIGASLFGLVLILSPYIVFSIINPQIVNLDLNFAAIAPSENNSSSNDDTTQQSNVWESTASDAKATCTQQGGTSEVTNTTNGVDTVRCTKVTGSCEVFEEGTTTISGTGALQRQACCAAQKAPNPVCSVKKEVRSTYECVCQKVN